MSLVIPAPIEALGHNYDVELGAFGFLGSHEFLVPVLEELAPALHEHFPDSKLTIEIAHDREGGASSYLAIMAHINLSLDEADERLTRFDQTWWRQNRSRVHGLIMVDVIFK